MDSIKSHQAIKISRNGDDFEVFETDAAKSCVRKVAKYFVVSKATLETRNLRTLISVIREQMLLLYFHKDHDEFSQTFCKSLTQTAMKTALKKFCILGWDVDETKYHEALVKALNDNDLQSLACLVECKISAAVCLQIVDGSVAKVISCLTGEMSESEILSDFEATQNLINKSAPSHSGTSETDAAKSCITKTARFCSTVKFENKELKQLQAELSTSGKTLLLFLYNELDEFSKTFCESLADTTVNKVLENFWILGWDVGESKYYNALSNTLISCNLHNLVCFIESKVSAVIHLQKIDEVVEAVWCLNGDVSRLEIVKQLEQIQAPLENEESENSAVSEIDAAKSCVRKLESYLIASPIKFETRDLKEVLVDSCFAPLEHRKIFMLYLHNEEDDFSKMFCKNLMTSNIKAILEDFCILGWDVSNTDYHEALKRTLSSNKLELVSYLVESKISALICWRNNDECIVPICCLKGIVSDSDLLEELAYVHNRSKNNPKKQSLLEKDNEINDINSKRYQQLMADMLGDRDYDLIDFDQREALERKISFALYGPPQNEEAEYQADQLKKIKKLCHVIVTESNQIAQYRDKIEISFIYNCIEPLPEVKIKRAKEISDYNPITDLMPIPLFILRKCRDSDNPCRIFIDDIGRVYSTWQDYKENNKLHKCIMVLPLNGKYEVDENGNVLLERLPSPACGAAKLALKVADGANTGVGLATGGVFLAAALTPVMPAVLVTAGIAGAITGVYSITRSAIHLQDKSKHKESISFADSDARGAYLNIVAGSLGFVGMGANMVVAQLASRGVNIGKGAIYTVNTVNVINLGASGASVINSGIDVIDQWINEDQKPSLLTIVQLSSSVLFFGNAVYNYKTAGSIIEESQARTMKDYQDSLRSNRHRKMFNKMMKETIRQNDGNANAGRAEVIKAVRNIPNKDEVFASLVRNNKQMNKYGVRFSASNGQIQFNGKNIDMGTFISMSKNEANMFLGKLPMKQNVTQADIRSMTQVYTANNLSKKMAILDFTRILNFSATAIGFLQGDVQRKIISALSDLLSNIPLYCEKMLKDLFPDVSLIYVTLLKVVMQFFADKAQELYKQYERWKATKSPEYYNPLFDFLDPTDEERTCKKLLENVVRACFAKGKMKEEALKNLLNYVYTWIAERIFQRENESEREAKRALHSSSFRTKSVTCGVCGGNYYSRIR